jgi:hypothetical protein
MIMHQDLLIEARREAQSLIESDPRLSQPSHHNLRNMIDTILKKPLDI